LMCMPSVVVHDIDEWSPLRYIMKECKRKEENFGLSQSAYPTKENAPNLKADALNREFNHDPSRTFLFPDVMQRGIDSRNGNREMNVSSADDDFKYHRKKKDDGYAEQMGLNDEEESLRKSMVATSAEIVVLIEGIDATTSYTIQARHSYTVTDVLFHHDFQPCVTELPSGGACLDFSKFHSVQHVEKEHRDLPPKYLFSCS